MIPDDESRVSDPRAPDAPVEETRAFDAETLRRVQPLWEFLAVRSPPIRADVIFVFGSQDLDVARRAAELYHGGYAPRVLVTGGYGRMTRGVFPKAEALVFKDHLLTARVPASAVVTEPSASNTLENVRLGMSALARANVHPTTLLLVAKGFVMRRCVATFGRQFHDVRVVPCPPRGGLETGRDRHAPLFVSRLVAEVDRLERYAVQGDICRQEIPATVRQIVSALSGRQTS